MDIQGRPLSFLNAHFSVTRGESALVLGSNGRGKSTLAKLIAGIIKPLYGEVVFNKGYQQFENGLSPKVGLVCQSSRSQIVGNSVEDLAFGLTVLQLPSRQIKEKVDSFLELFGLYSKRFHSINQLSGGELRRLALAAVLITDPDILILDEPLAMVDGLNQEVLLRYLQNNSMKAILWLDNDLKSIRYTKNWYLTELDRYGKIMAITEQDLNSKEFLQKHQLTPLPLEYLEWRYPERVAHSILGRNELCFDENSGEFT